MGRSYTFYLVMQLTHKGIHSERARAMKTLNFLSLSCSPSSTASSPQWLNLKGSQQKVRKTIKMVHRGQPSRAPSCVGKVESNLMR